jgi:hypothetical protein
MKTHPEEFAVGEGVIGKWDTLIREYETILDPEDVALFRQARGKLLQQQFTEKVMEELIDPKKSKWETVGMVSTNTPSVGQTPSPYTDKSTIEHMQIHVDALKSANRNELLNKKSTTIFGKLFNYS